MTQDSLKLLHIMYNEAVERSNSITEIQENLYKLISEKDFSAEDSEEVDKFLLKLKASSKIRQRTFQMTNVAINIAEVILYIAIWANSEKHMDVDINLTVRRKALESEMTKFLRKEEIFDLFGIRCNLLNNNSEEEAETKIVMFSKLAISILTQENRKELQDFCKWVNKNAIVTEPEKQKIHKTLDSLPLKVINTKDYIKNPKENGYKSLHYIVTIEMFSEILPGASLEIQFRSNFMHQTAVNGTAKHTDYKKSEESEFKNVFKIDNVEDKDLHIIGFTSYCKQDDDIDGLHYHKLVYNRRISKIVEY